MVPISDEYTIPPIGMIILTIPIKLLRENYFIPRQANVIQQMDYSGECDVASTRMRTHMHAAKSKEMEWMSDKILKSNPVAGQGPIRLKGLKSCLVRLSLSWDPCKEGGGSCHSLGTWS